ncbi:MAG: MFS transporter [Dongiaceae bacterium]
MSSPVASSGGIARSLAVVITAMFMVNANYGLSIPLLANNLSRMGASDTLVGLSTAAQALPVLFIAPFAQRLMAALSPARIMGICITMAAVALLLFPIFRDPWAWFPLRCLLGASANLLWISGETWINSLATEERRGRIVSLYGMASSGGFAAGPLVLFITGTEGWTPFVAGSALMLSALLTLGLARNVPRDFSSDRPVRISVLIWLWPVPFLLNFLFAGSVEALASFFSLLGVRLGLEEASTFALLAVLGIGSLLMQYPFGWLADHMDRKRLLIIVISLVIGGTLVLPWVLRAGLGVAFPFMIVYGGLLSTLYPMGVVLLGERFRGGQLAAASAGFTMMWAMGFAVGPPVAGFFYDIFDTPGLILSIAGFLAAFLVAVPFVWKRKPTDPIDARE